MNLLEAVEKRVWIDYRVYYLLYEHKLGMIRNLRYCIDKKYLGKVEAEELVKRYEKLAKQYKTFMYMVLKYNAQLYANIKNYRFDISFSQVKEEEVIILEELLELLSL